MESNFTMRAEILSFMQTYSWVFLVAFLIDGVFLIITLTKRQKQKSDESDIMNMFDERGELSEHQEHREYNATTQVFLGIVLFMMYVVAISI